VPDAPPRPLRSDAERNRRLVLEAAAAVFAERGLEAGVAEVAQRAGVGSATVFRRFPSKQELIVAVIEARIAEMREQLDAALAADPWEGLVAAMESIARLQARDRGLFEAIGSHVSGDEHLHARHAELLETIGRVAQRAKDAGHLRGDVEATDLPMLAAAAAGTCQAAGGAPDLWRRYLGIMLDGLRPGGATPLPVPAQTLEEILAAKAAARGMSDRAEQVLARVRAIPPGFVRAYGDVSPGAPRFAGTVLSGTDEPGLPWHRVVRADGSLAKGERQRRLLEAEGVPFRGDRVDVRLARLPD
jgi:AcrR family transcriptional regulator